MKTTFNQAVLNVEYWNKPEEDKGEVNPYVPNDPEQKHNAYIKSSTTEIPEELLPELIEFLEGKGVFMGALRGVMNEHRPPDERFTDKG